MLTLVATALSGFLGAGVALAASFGVISTKLTVDTSVSSIAPTTGTLSAADADSYVSELSLLSNFGTRHSICTVEHARERISGQPWQDRTPNFWDS